jgi:uncharacterized protein YutE (UPF0331/DUF86 family)
MDAIDKINLRLKKLLQYVEDLKKYRGITAYRFRPPDSHKDAIIILGEEGVLPKEFAAEISGIAGFRNLLVHDYIKIDYDKVADKVNNRLGDFVTFAKSVAKYLT